MRNSSPLQSPKGSPRKLTLKEIMNEQRLNDTFTKFCMDKE